jgi:hypothetical protein
MTGFAMVDEIDEGHRVDPELQEEIDLAAPRQTRAQANAAKKRPRPISSISITDDHQLKVPRSGVAGGLKGRGRGRGRGAHSAV